MDIAHIVNIVLATLLVMLPGDSDAVSDQQRSFSVHIRYTIEPLKNILEDHKKIQKRFTDSQILLLEKLNRADVNHLEQLTQLVVPEV